MQISNQLVAILSLLFVACIPASAQLTPSEPDPLARIRDAAAANVQACSATGETLCEQVAPKIIANAEGNSPLAENLRRLRVELASKGASNAEESAVAWAMAAFRDAGLDPHVEKFANSKAGGADHHNVVVEYPGRDHPEEWVLVAAHIGPQQNVSGTIDNSCDAASVIEAARDISRTAVHPRRSIRFVLFTDDQQPMRGSQAYVRSHSAELDQARGAIIFHSNCARVAGFSIGGSGDLESALREAMKPLKSLDANRLNRTEETGSDDFSFLLEGVPTLSAYPSQHFSTDAVIPGRHSAEVELEDVKHNIAVVAATAFGIAEGTSPIGPREPHPEIEIHLVN